VSYLPLASVNVRAGSTVRAGAAIGTLAPGHDGLHLGVRRESDPFGYEDPAALLPSARPPTPLAPPRRTPRRAPRPPVTPRPRGALPRPTALAPHAAPRTIHLPAHTTALDAAPRTASAAPPAVWAGLALIMTGAVGSGTAIAIRRRRSGRLARARAASPA
jgi:hypothetical protein